MPEENHPSADTAERQGTADETMPSNVRLMADYVRVSTHRSARVSKTTAQGRKTLTITLTPQSFSVLQALYPTATDKEILIHALAFFLHVGQRIKEGRIIASIDEEEKSYREIVSPLFEKMERQDAEIKPFPGTPKP